MIKRRDSPPYLADACQVDVGKAQPFAITHVQQDLSPWIDQQRMAIGLAAIVVPSALRRGDNEAAGLDGSGSQEHFPMGLARRDGECRGNCDYVRTCLGQPSEQCREPQVITNGQSQRSNWRSLD